MHQYLLRKTNQNAPNWPKRSKLRSNPIHGACQAFARAVRKPSLLALAVALAMMLFFTAWPDIDLDVSRGFWTDGFRHGEDAFLLSVRDLNRALPALLLSGLVSILLVRPFSAGLQRNFRPHQLLLILTFYVLGPGATVDVVKNLFGRARPRHLGDFGGELFFTPVLSLEGTCLRNCSFPSGESASAIALLAFIILLPKKFRLVGAAVLMPFIMIFSLNRVAMGAHFLSDVLIAWPLMLAVFLLLHRPFTKYRETIDAAFSRKANRNRHIAEQ
ncbi:MULTISPECIES: phosphatase PAP2 family protein [Rhizobium/Agrobacterium group]|uniref:Membrane protein n=1 Tax=Agrobacterium tomkonis CFBP 6623 TaxID=1183432 RepID=A0A1S7RGF4_9HYPH|nr:MULTISPECIES: phosphatase PAP2 family protein [Rhizobium/Agrobacterium group]MBP8937800.1 phosphatase PAP2 family protein [Agrobacterium sp.]KRA56454.1 hypothetical protein ASD85_19420 [Rhizobium sp. Root651]QCL91545.1 phosphatase PAP2 family protein [Agrobacterium tumefaciens]TKT57166.1 phosphatase PAP2 family protein [Agrobacterium sp. LC34]CUX52154.1 Membrane protein [Agrobacterium tomkonis CFBP 6623]